MALLTGDRVCASTATGQASPRPWSAPVLIEPCLDKTAAPQQVGKPWLATERVPLGIHGQKDEMHISRVVAAFQPLQSEFELTQPRMYHRHSVGRNISFPGNRQQCLQDILRLFASAQPAEYITPQCDYL